MHNYYLIDFENVREAGLAGANELSPDSHIYLFYTDNANRLGLDSIAGIDAEFRAVKVVAGRQSLDMHLISFLGYIIGRSNEECTCTIISNDKGFDGTIAFWNASGLAACARRGRISSAPAAAEKSAEDKPAEKQVAKAKPERRDKSRRQERRRNTQNEKPAAEAKETAVAETPVESIAAEPDPKLEETLPAEDEVITVSESETVTETVTSVEESSVSTETAEEPEKPAEEPALPRKKTHRGGRGRGKKNAEQKSAVQEEKQAPEEVSSTLSPESKIEEPAAEVKVQPSVNPKIAENLRSAEVGDDIIAAIEKIVVSCADKKNVKQAVYREIIRRYGQKQGLEYYGIIKKNV